MWTERQKRRGREWVGMKTAQLSRGQTNAACCCILVTLQDKQLKRKQKLPKHIQKYLPEEEKKEKEPMEERRRKRQTVPATKVKPEREKGTLKSQEL